MATILVVDDSEIIRSKMTKILVNAGHEVVAEASNGLQAIQEFKKHQPDIVTMDMDMPVMDGVDAVENLLMDYSYAKIIMVSAIEDKVKIFEALEKGAKHYILKPFDQSEVIRIVDSVLGGEEYKSIL